MKMINGKKVNDCSKCPYTSDFEQRGSLLYAFCYGHYGVSDGHDERDYIVDVRKMDENCPFPDVDELEAKHDN